MTPRAVDRGGAYGRRHAPERLCLASRAAGGPGNRGRARRLRLVGLQLVEPDDAGGRHAVGSEHIDHDLVVKHGRQPEPARNAAAG
jgi:hypothetical protein